jgi:peroxiredoxin
MPPGLARGGVAAALLVLLLPIAAGQAVPRIAGRVVDADTGERIRSFRVIRGVGPAPSGPVNWMRNAVQYGRLGKFSAVFEPNWVRPDTLFYVRIEAQGYLPEDSRGFAPDEPGASYSFRLTPAEALAGIVRDGAGDPVQGVDVYLITADRPMYVRNGRAMVDGTANHAVTDSAGQFKLDPSRRPYWIVALAEGGMAELEVDMLASAPYDLELTPWGRVEGQALVGSEPAAYGVAALESVDAAAGAARGVQMAYVVETDGEGRFTFERVAPGVYMARRDVGGRTPVYAQAKRVRVEPGETHTLQLGGAGRTVTGVIAEFPTPSPTSHYSAIAVFEKPPLPMPAAIRSADTQTQAKWMQEWQQSEEGLAFARLSRSSYNVALSEEGRFRIEEVPSGAHQLTIRVTHTPVSEKGIPLASEAFGIVEQSFEVPEGGTEEAVDLGELALSEPVQTPSPGMPGMPESPLKVGEPVPEFSAETLDGEALSLSDFKGKYVVLDFWATWCGPCVAELPNMKKLYAEFGEDPRFEMISLSVDDTIAEPQAFVKQHGLDWVQVYLGEWSTTDVPDQFGVFGIPAMFLVDPEGNLVAQDLRGTRLHEAVRRALEK